MSSVTAGSTYVGVPKPIIDKLQAVVRRARLVLLVRGVLGVISVALLALLTGMAIDASFTIFSVALRLSISLVLLSTVLLALVFLLIRPLARSLSLTGVARLIESRRPELEERISSAVELLTSRDSSELKGSEVMIREVSRQAVGQVGTVLPEQEFSFDKARPFLLSTTFAIAIIAVLFILWPGPTKRLMNRVLAPLANIGNVQATDLEVKPGDLVIASGDSLRIEVIVANQRVQTAQVYRGDQKTDETSERMKNLSPDERGYPRFFLSIPQITESFQYRIHAGNALTQYFDVQVVPRPAVEIFQITYDYPDYTSRSPKTVTQKDGDIEGPIGSQVTLVARTNTTLAEAHLSIAGLASYAATIEPASEGGSLCTWRIPLTEDFVIGRTWNLKLRDPHGFVNWPAEYLIKAVRDKAPTVIITDPSEEALRMKFTDSLPLHYRAEDDYGIASTNLLVSIDGKDVEPTLVFPPRDVDLAGFNGLNTIRLSQFADKTNRVMTVQLQVRDNLPSDLKGPHLAVSRIVTIMLDETSETYFEKQAARDYASLRDALRRALETLQTAEKQSAGLDNAARSDGRLEEVTLKRIDQIRDLADGAGNVLREIAETLPDTAFARLEPEVANLAETDVAEARQQAGRVKLSDTAEQRATHARASDQHVKQAIVRTEKLIADLDTLWNEVQKIADLQDLAARQSELAESIANADAEQLAELPLAEQQAQLAKEIVDVVKSSPEVLKDVLRDKQQQAENLVQAANQLAEQQASLAELTDQSNQPNVDPSELQNKIAEAIQKQQEQIAAETAMLDTEIEQTGKAGADEQSNLATATKEVVADLQEGDLADAEMDAQAAAQQLDSAAEALEAGMDVPNASPKSSGPQAGQPQSEKPQPAKPQPGDVGKPQPNQPEAGKPQPGQAQPGQPQPGEPQPSKPQPSQPEPGQPQPGEPQPSKPQPGQPEPGKPQPGEPQPGQAQPGQPQPGEPQPGKPQPSQPEPGQPQSGEPQPGQAEAGKPPLGEPEPGQPRTAKANAAPVPTDANDPGEMVGRQPTTAPEALPALAEQAAKLAERQRNVARQLASLKRGNLDEALALMQEQVAAETATLAMKSELLADVVELLNQPAEAQASARQAATELTAAASQADMANEQLEPFAPQAASGTEPMADAGEGTESAQAATAAATPAAKTTPADQPNGNQPASKTPMSDSPTADPAAEKTLPGAAPAAPMPANGQTPSDQPTAEPTSNKEVMPTPGANPQLEPPQVQNNQPTKQSAVGAQRNAAQSLSRAAQALENLGNQIEASAEPLPDEPLASLPTEAAAENLANALDAAANAMAALPSQTNATPAQAAAEAAAQQTAAELANAANAAAQQAGIPDPAANDSASPPPSENSLADAPPPANAPSDSQNSNASSQPSNQTGTATGPQGRKGGTVDNELQGKLEEYGISVADWTRLPGNLKNQIRQAEADGAPEEYRAMVRQYFRELALRNRRSAN